MCLNYLPKSNFNLLSHNNDITTSIHRYFITTIYNIPIFPQKEMLAPQMLGRNLSNPIMRANFLKKIFQKQKEASFLLLICRFFIQI